MYDVYNAEISHEKINVFLQDSILVYYEVSMKTY